MRKYLNKTNYAKMSRALTKQYVINGQINGPAIKHHFPDPCSPQSKEIRCLDFDTQLRIS